MEWIGLDCMYVGRYVCMYVGSELLGGALFYPWKGLVAGLKRALHMGCMMPSVEGMRESRLQRASVDLLGGALF